MSLTFNGTSSDNIGVVVERYPPRSVPSRIVETVRIPGRNGLLTRSTGYDNVIQDYEVYLSAAANGLPSAAADMAAWLLAPDGYCRLEDSYNTGEYRMARFVNPMAITNYFNRFGRCILSFDCMPQRFLSSGETATTYSSDDTIDNPTAFPALPMIEVIGSGDIEFSVGGTSVVVEDLASAITLDCENQNAYNGTTNLNGSVTLSGGTFPVLEPGTNAITFTTGSITSITITPRWWIL